MRKVKPVAILALAVVSMMILTTAYAQAPPPYIQPGLVFVYQVINVEKNQPENAFQRYIIESVTSQAITISIMSDIAQSGRITVNANGEFRPGERIDLWIPPDVTAGTRFKMMGVDAYVARRGYEMQGFKLTVVVSADQSIFWTFIEDGPSPYNQLKGLLLYVLFTSSKKALGLASVEQAGSVTTTSTYSTTVRTTTARPVTTSRTTMMGGSTVTVVETETVTETVVVTRTVGTASTYVTTSTQTVSFQAESPPISLPLTIAIPVAAVIVGGGLFYVRSRRRPLPPTYPYPSYPPPSPSGGYYPQPQPAVAHPVGACPACRFPIYPGDAFCRRCGYRFA
ncbi:MAG: zinc ribbon domain-containing protein [Candidatus Caldarchaeum sp.]